MLRATHTLRAPALNKTGITMAALFIACICSVSLFINVESNDLCSASEKRRLMQHAIEHTQGVARYVTCEQSVLTLIYTHGGAGNVAQAIVLRQSVTGSFDVLFVSEPHLHADTLSD